jgi:hypothetical protein
MIALPGYIDREAWQGFEDMRKTIKKPLTDRSRKLIVYELDRIKTAGHCPNAALDQSTCHCWADVYPSKDKPIEASGTSAHEKTQQYLAEHSRTPDPQARERLAEIRGKLRRIA